MIFTRNLLLLTLVLLGAIICINQYAPEKFHSPNAYFALGYFAALTFIFHNMAVRSAAKDPRGFIRFFMGSTALRLFIHLIVVVTYKLLFRETATSFLVAFMFLYLIFQVFEVSTLLKHLKKN
jgi:hypothetical protein